MERIDSHQNFWNYDPGRQNWKIDEMEILKKDYSPEHLTPLLKDCNLQGSIAVQASQTGDENGFLVQLTGKNKGFPACHS